MPADARLRSHPAGLIETHGASIVEVLDDLYRRGGEYEYSNGWNVQALIAFALGVLPCLPGYLAVSGVVDKASVPGLLLALFDFGWFFSLAVAGTYYYLTAKKK